MGSPPDQIDSSVNPVDPCTPPPFGVTERELRDTRKAVLKSSMAWGISAILHALLVMLFMGIGWKVGLATGEGKSHVTIVNDSERDIQAMPADLDALAAPITEITHELQTPPQVDASQITDLSVSPNLSNTDTLVGIEMASSGDVGAVTGDEFSTLGVSGSGAGGDGSSFFGLKAQGNSFVFVVDRSGSMSGQRLALAKAELTRSLSRFKSRNKFYVIFYNDTAEPMPGTMLYRATQSNLRKANTWINTINTRGGTDPTEAMMMALELKPDVIWLLSDGAFSEDVIDKVRNANPGADVQIHTIAFLNRSGERILKAIAEQNRGNYRFVK